MKVLSPLLLLPLLFGPAACGSLKNSSAMKPGQTAQKFSLERKQVFSADYILFLPEGYGVDAAKRWPLILFLHGAGERGSNVWLVTKHGVAKVDTQQAGFPFIVVAPQCPKGKIW